MTTSEAISMIKRLVGDEDPLEVAKYNPIVVEIINNLQIQFERRLFNLYYRVALKLTAMTSKYVQYLIDHDYFSEHWTFTISEKLSKKLRRLSKKKRQQVVETTTDLFIDFLMNNFDRQVQSSCCRLHCYYHEIDDEITEDIVKDIVNENDYYLRVTFVEKYIKNAAKMIK